MKVRRSAAFILLAGTLLSISAHATDMPTSAAPYPSLVGGGPALNSASVILPTGHVAGPGAAVAAKLFFDNCIAYAGRAAQLKVRLDSLYNVIPSKTDQLFLDQKPGKVWITRAPEGNFGFVVFDDGACTIKAETVPVTDTMAAVEKEAAARRMQAITVADDKTAGYEGLTGHNRDYDLVVAGLRRRIVVSGVDAHMSLFESEITMPAASAPTPAKMAPAKMAPATSAPPAGGR